MPASKDVSLTIRVSAELRDAFAAACGAEDVPAAQVLRAAMRRYVEARPELPLGAPATGRALAQEMAAASKARTKRR